MSFETELKQSTNQPQESTAGGIDWGDSESTPVEIEIVDVGTDCKCVGIYWN